MADLRLGHLTHQADTTFYFYEGELPVKRGVLTLPSGRADLLTRAWAKGYRVNLETHQEYIPDEARAHLSA